MQASYHPVAGWPTLRVRFFVLSLIPLRAWGGSRRRGRYWRSRPAPPNRKLVTSERWRRETREIMLEVVHRSAPKGGNLSRKWHKAVQNDDEKVADRGRSVLADVAESVCSGRGRCRRRWGRKVEPLHPGRTIRGANFVKPKHGARCAVERHGKVRDRRDVPGGEAITCFRFIGAGRDRQ